MMLRYLCVLFLAILHPSTCLVAYDCGGTGLNVTTVSLLDVGECDVSRRQTNETDVSIQLLQLSNFDHTTVIHCRIEITRIIYHCGMHSHASVVHNGQNEYLHDVSYHACKRLHEDGSMTLGPYLYLTGFKINTTSSRPVTFAGVIETDGDCSGTTYSDPYGTWDNVVVQGTVRVTLRTSTARVNVNAGKIIMNSGTSCNLQNGHCIDDDSGHSFWMPLPNSQCNFRQYDLLYEGKATRIFDTVDTVSPTIYTLTTREVTFALAKTGETRLCGYTLFRTEHPRLFILESQPGQGFARRKTIPADNLDIFTYVNSKFVYVERHIRGQIDNLYHDVLTQRCRLERQILKNAISLARYSPEEFAYILMKGPGYISVAAGEVAHLLKCVPVNVKIHHGKVCYNELPVVKGNQTFYATPKTRILIKSGTIRDCSNFLPVMYNIEGEWHRFTPNPTESLPPQTLTPSSTPTWKYLTPASLATSGIYSEEDLERLRNHIMFPAEKAAVLNTIARGANGQPIVQGSISMYNLLDEESLNKITESAVSKVWQGFISFGSASAGVLAIFVVIRLVKLLFDTIIRGYALHSVYGWSLHIFGAVWSSVSNLLLYLAARRPKLPASAEALPSPKSEENPIDNQPVGPPSSCEDPRSQPLSAPPTTLPRTSNKNATAPTPNPSVFNCSYEELRERIARIDQNLTRSQFIPGNNERT